MIHTFVVYYWKDSEELGFTYESIELQAETLPKCYTLAKRIFGSKVVAIVTKDFDNQFIKGEIG